jgi:hypothetical protein
MEWNNLYAWKMGDPEAGSRLLFKLLSSTNNAFPGASQKDMRLDLFADLRSQFSKVFPVVL